MLNRCYLKKLTISKMCKRPRGVQYITRAVCLSTTDVDLRRLDYWGRKKKREKKKKEDEEDPLLPAPGKCRGTNTLGEFAK